LGSCRLPNKLTTRFGGLTFEVFMLLSELLKQTSYAEQVQALGFCREVLQRLAKRRALVIDGVVYAPVAKRKR